MMVDLDPRLLEEVGDLTLAMYTYGTLRYHKSNTNCISIKRNRKQLISCQKQDAEFPHQELNGI
jgi:hypothetical protein